MCWWWKQAHQSILATTEGTVPSRIPFTLVKILKISLYLTDYYLKLKYFWFNVEDMIYELFINAFTLIISIDNVLITVKAAQRQIYRLSEYLTTSNDVWKKIILCFNIPIFLTLFISELNGEQLMIKLYNYSTKWLSYSLENQHGYSCFKENWRKVTTVTKFLFLFPIRINF